MPALQELLIDEMKDMIHAESQAVKAYPKMMRAAKNPKLKQALEKHLEETKNQVERLKQAFQMLGSKAQAKTCRAMMGLIEEGEETIEEGKSKDPIAADLALIAVAQKVEHYEISGYGTVRSIARLARENEVAQLMQMTLGEEEATDFLLTEIAKPMLQESATELYATALSK